MGGFDLRSGFEKHQRGDVRLAFPRRQNLNSFVSFVFLYFPPVDWPDRSCWDLLSICPHRKLTRTCSNFWGVSQQRAMEYQTGTII